MIRGAEAAKHDSYIANLNFYLANQSDMVMCLLCGDLMLVSSAGDGCSKAAVFASLIKRPPMMAPPNVNCAGTFCH